ncbi:MAG TPA: hypothetical protein VHW67_14235 [Solirubrobacteraceae bacterium]|jgi:hypothetical protein|nr:hypothetical protein [Solirubrobacteraceae bacterium]
MSFEASRLRLGDRIVAVGALALFIFLFFFHWYGGSIEGLPAGSHISGATISSSGWDVFTSSRWVWLVTTVVALGAVLAAGAAYKLDGPVQLGAVVLGFGALSCVLILYRIFHHPGANVSGHGLQIHYGIKLGIWLGLLAALAITGGGYLQLLAEGEERNPKPRERPAAAAAPFSGLTVSDGEDAVSAGGEDRAPTAP